MLHPNLITNLCRKNKFEVLLFLLFTNLYCINKIEVLFAIHFCKEMSKLVGKLMCYFSSITETTEQLQSFFSVVDRDLQRLSHWILHKKSEQTGLFPPV